MCGHPRSRYGRQLLQQERPVPRPAMCRDQQPISRGPIGDNGTDSMTLSRDLTAAGTAPITSRTDPPTGPVWRATNPSDHARSGSSGWVTHRKPPDSQDLFAWPEQVDAGDGVPCAGPPGLVGPLDGHVVAHGSRILGDYGV